MYIKAYFDFNPSIRSVNIATHHKYNSYVEIKRRLIIKCTDFKNIRHRHSFSSRKEIVSKIRFGSYPTLRPPADVAQN